MRIFISYSKKDISIVNQLSTALEEQGHEILQISDVEVGETWIDSLKNKLNSSDYFIAIIDDNYLDSSWANAELSCAVFNNNIAVIPVVVGNIFLPNILIGHYCININSLKEITSEVLSYFKKVQLRPNDVCFKNKLSIQTEKNDTNKKIEMIKTALNENQLTLVCGAGVSVSSLIPTWDELLRNVLSDMFFRTDEEILKQNSSELLSSMPSSNLILGKYLRLILKDDFEKVIGKHLYSNYNQNIVLRPGTDLLNQETEIMKSISILASPRRNGGRLDSIINFNFDNLIEKSLSLHNIEFCSIWDEGQEHTASELPVYHVHGFLPHNINIENPNLVFSEETYHSQFIDPYSWSNLIQLNTFSENICLFVGLSLSDPNLRRLLDISWRKNQKRKHYIITRKPEKSDKIGEIISMLFEQDANSLGLNVIWCNDYSQIPELIMKIAR